MFGGVIIGIAIHLTYVIGLIAVFCGAKFYFVGSILDTVAFCIILGTAIPKLSSTADNPNQDIGTTYKIITASLAF